MIIVLSCCVETLVTNVVHLHRTAGEQNHVFIYIYIYVNYLKYIKQFSGH